MILTNSDSHASCILLSMISKSWRSFNPNNIIKDIDQNIIMKELDSSQKCKFSVKYELAISRLIAGSEIKFSFNNFDSVSRS